MRWILKVINNLIQSLIQSKAKKKGQTSEKCRCKDREPSLSTDKLRYVRYLMFAYHSFTVDLT